MQSKGWSKEKQIKTAKKLGFEKLEPFEIDREKFHQVPFQPQIALFLQF